MVKKTDQTPALLFTRMPDCLLMQEMETFFPGKGVPLNLSSLFVIVSDLTGGENADMQYELCNTPRSRLM